MKPVQTNEGGPGEDGWRQGVHCLRRRNMALSWDASCLWMGGYICGQSAIHRSESRTNGISSRTSINYYITTVAIINYRISGNTNKNRQKEKTLNLTYLYLPRRGKMVSTGEASGLFLWPFSRRMALSILEFIVQIRTRMNQQRTTMEKCRHKWDWFSRTIEQWTS